ncbi:hypothetical protein C8J57DRAFT_948984, partial [Mycena rebaudengoi]
PSAFYDHPAIRNAYIRVFVGCAFEHMTHSAARLMLDGTALGLESARRSTGMDIPGLDTFARTLATVEKRLGVSTHGFITYLFVCNVCWQVHRPEDLHTLPESGACTDDDCEGTLFTTKRMSDGKLKRTPTKIMPYVDPARAIAHRLARPGKYEQLQLWRGPGDAPGPTPPLNDHTGYDAFSDPDKPMKHISDGWAWRAISAGLTRRRTGDWKVEDVDVHELDQRFVSLPCGLVWQINIDWFVSFQAVKGGNHSTGAVYMTLLNNPIAFQSLREETDLVMMPPGPHEPSLEQLNHVFFWFVQSMKQLYNGVEFRVHGIEKPLLTHSQILSNVSDLPASRKTAGLPSHNSKYFMCPHCYMHFYELTTPECFNPSCFELRDDWRHLKYAFRARDASPEIAEEIFRKRGIRWSVLNELVNWLPARSSTVEPMHCLMLTLIRHVNRKIIYTNGLLNSEGSGSHAARMEALFSSIIWPVSVGRLPPSITHSGTVKADQWRTQISVLFIALFDAWQVDGEIPDIDAPPSASNTKLYRAQQQSEKLVVQRLMETLMARNPNPTEEDIAAVKATKMDRSLRRHYDAILQFTAAIRILCTQEISPNDVKRAFSALSHAVQSWARMNCHLTPYFHFAFHMEPQFYEMGSLYAWWAYAYERNNGFLGKFNHNGHSGGELEGTMMRGWWKANFIHDLITNLEAIPNPSVEDLDSIALLKSYLKGGTKERKDRIQFSRFSTDVSLRTLGQGYYRLVFQHLQQVWGSKIRLYSDVAMDIPAGASIFAGRVSSFSHVFVNKRRYGAATTSRGQSAQYAYIDTRIPVQIQYIFRAVQPQTGGPTHTTEFAIVRRFCTDEHMFQFPWDIWAVDLGVAAWYAGRLGAVEVVPLTRLSGHLILVPITVRNTELWITVAHDH